MISSDDLTPLFRQLGLSNYESRIWQALLDKGEADAQDLIKTTGVPFGRVYDVLNGLVARDIIEVQETRPKRYRPRRIGDVIDRLIQTKKASVDSEFRQLEEAGEAVKRRFAELGRRLPKDEVFVSVALGEQDIQTMLRDLEFSAEKEILIAMGHVEVPARLAHLAGEAANRLLSAAARGVSVRLIFAESVPQIPSALKSFESNVEKAKGRFQVRLYPGVLNHFKVIDRRYVAMEVVDPYEPDSRIALVQVLSKKLADHMVQVFERCWRGSLPPRRGLAIPPRAKETSVAEKDSR